MITAKEARFVYAMYTSEVNYRRKWKAISLALKHIKEALDSLEYKGYWTDNLGNHEFRIVRAFFKRRGFKVHSISISGHYFEIYIEG